MPKLPFGFSNKFSKDAREGAKLDRLASKRLGGTSPVEPSPTARHGWRSRGASTLHAPQPIGDGVDPESPMARRRSSVSLQSDGSAMKGIGENFGKNLAEYGDTKLKMSSLRSDYKSLIKMLDHLDHPGWKRLAGHLKQDEVKLRLMETTMSTYPEDIRNLSHQLIFRFVMAGFLKFLTEELELEQYPTQPEIFIKEHLEFLSANYPAALLGATILTEHAADLKTLEEHIESEWGETTLPEVLHESMLTIQKYTQRFGGIPQSVQKHTRYLLNTVSRLEGRNQIMDVFVFTGLLPWSYFQLDPDVNEREWIRRSLRVDKKYWALIDDLFSDPLARYKAVQNIGHYYEEDPSTNTVLHLMIYLWAMHKFGINPTSEPPEGVDKIDLHDCSQDLVEHFTPGSWRSQTYYVCTQGDTLVWALSTLPPTNQTGLLVRLIIQNLANWAPVTENSTLQLGMIRTLYISLQSCGVDDFLSQAKPGELAALGWHLGTYFRRHPVEHVTRKASRSELKKEKGSPKKRHEAIPLEVEDSLAQSEIESVLLKDKQGWNFPPSSIPTTAPDAVERWKLKIRLSTAILKKILIESGENTAKELFQALLAVNVTERLKKSHVAGMDPAPTSVNPDSTSSLTTSISTTERSEETNIQDDKNLLVFLIEKLKEEESRKPVLDDADLPNIEALEIAKKVDPDTKSV